MRRMLRTRDAQVWPQEGLRDAEEPSDVASPTRAVVLDCAFLAIMSVLSLVLYVGRLGFYYDDYQLLERMGESGHQSVLGLYDAVSPGTGQRPLQALTYAVLYRLFGAEPLGYHVFNAIVFECIVELEVKIIHSSIRIQIQMIILGLDMALCNGQHGIHG